MIFDLDGTPSDIGFPDTHLAETEPNGLLAIGGDLKHDRLVQAYRKGIFPWFSRGQPILWWSPAPRMVLFPDEFHLSRSLRKSLRKRGYMVSIDQAFESTIRACSSPRRDGDGTWLLPEMVSAYCGLYAIGIAHSFEVWREEQLIGGLYGIALGEVFFGESMFSAEADGSKTALALLVELALRRPFRVIDCQVYTDHLASLGAREIGREPFERLLKRHVDRPTAPMPRIARFPAAELRSAS